MRSGRMVSAAVVTVVLAACGGTDGSDTGGQGATTTVKRPAEVFEAARPSTVQLRGKQGEADVGGTGVIFDAAKGLILTNAHVVAGVAALKARVMDQTETPARVLAAAPCDDVAVVQLPTVPPGLKAIPVGDSNLVRNQDEVVALGYPASFADPTTQKVVSTSGTVQSPNIAAEPDKSLPKFPSLIQHSATINPGNSGGPLLNLRSELIGINTLRNIGSRSQPIQGQYYAISVNHIKTILPNLIAGKNRANPGWNIAPFAEVPLSEVFAATGYGTAEDGERADRFLAQRGVDGIFVIGADADGPADRAKLEFGDLVMRMKGTPVTSVAQVCDVLLSASPGETLTLEGLYLVSSGGDFGDPWTTKLTLPSY
jgi:S1-C subfamily serine protease